MGWGAAVWKAPRIYGSGLNKLADMMSPFSYLYAIYCISSHRPHCLRCRIRSSYCFHPTDSMAFSCLITWLNWVCFCWPGCCIQVQSLQLPTRYTYAYLYHNVVLNSVCLWFTTPLSIKTFESDGFHHRVCMNIGRWPLHQKRIQSTTNLTDCLLTIVKDVIDCCQLYKQALCKQHNVIMNLAYDLDNWQNHENSCKCTTINRKEHMWHFNSP